MEGVTVAAVEHLLKASRSAIIDRLKWNGAMSVEELAQALNVSKVCIRRHLALLESDGLIEHEEQRHERGRPRHIYRLTEKADCLFPRAYDAFARDVLARLECRFGAALLVEILQARADNLIDQFKAECTGLDFDQSIERLAQLISERGYVAEAQRQQDGSYRLVQRNCPIESIAAAYPQVCEQERRVYQEVLDCAVMCECRISNGARVCEYRILPSEQHAALRVLPS